MYRSRIILIAVAAIIFESCRTTPPAVTDLNVETPVNEPVLVQLGDNSFTTKEFEASFEKNKYSVDLDHPLTPEAYLDLFTRMKLKVLRSEEHTSELQSR